MEGEDKSEITKIIEERIKEVVDAEKKTINEDTERITDRAIERINGVYASIINTLRLLDIKDASLLDFYTKAAGRVRTVEIEGRIDEYEKKLNLNLDSRTLTHEDPILIKPGKKYKVLLIAIEE